MSGNISNDISVFIDALPKIFAGRDSLFAFFSTYGEIGGYKSGPVVTEMQNLQVHVACGQMDPTGLISLYAAMCCAVGAHDAIRVLENEAARAQDDSEAVAVDGPEDGRNMFFVIYAGLTAFEKAMGYLHTMRRKYPKMFAVVLTCTCSIEEKMRLLKPRMDAGMIDHLIVTPYCGGYGDMSTLVKQTIFAWRRLQKVPKSTDVRS